MADMELFLMRMIRAAKLDIDLFEEVEADKSTIWQAAGVIILSSFAAGIGAIPVAGLKGIVTGTVMALIGWCVWAYITYILGTKVLPEPQTEADYGELLRTLGFASAPGIIRILGIIPGLLWPVTLVATVWMIAAMVVAVRQALDYKSTYRAVGVCIIGWVIQIIFMIVLFSIFGSPGQAV